MGLAKSALPFDPNAPASPPTPAATEAVRYSLAQLLALEDRALDAVAAETVMGWAGTHDSKHYQDGGMSSDSYCGISWKVGKPPEKYYTESEYESLVPRYSHDIAAAFELQNKISELGFVNRFCITLREATYEETYPVFTAEWLLINASAKQRTIAAILTAQESAR